MDNIDKVYKAAALAVEAAERAAQEVRAALPWLHPAAIAAEQSRAAAWRALREAGAKYW